MIFTIHTSDGKSCRADDEDLEKLEQNVDSFMVKLKQGIVRPPFITIILPTGESSFSDKYVFNTVNGERKVSKVRGDRKLQDLMQEREKNKRIEI